MTGRQPRYVLMRRVVAGAFAFLGLFVSCYGLGSGSQAVLVIGAMLLVLAGGSRLWAGGFRRPPRQWLRGTGRVMEVSDPPSEFRFGRCSLRLVVEAPGLPGEQVTVHESRVPVEIWPRPGQALPLQVAADDIRKVRVLWREIDPAEAATHPTTAPPAWQEEPPEPTPADDPSTVRLPPVDEAVDFDLDHPPGPLTPGVTVPAARSPEAVGAPAPEAAGATATSEVAESTATPDEPGAEAPEVRPAPESRETPEGPEHPAEQASEETPAGRTSEETPAGPVGEAQADDGPADAPHRVLPRPRPSPRPRPTPAGAADPGAFGVGITVLVSDLPRSVTFYRDTLGFTEVDSGEDASVLASGATRLVLRQATDLGAVKRRLVHLNLEVGDIDATYAELKAGGVRFTYPPRAANRTARLEQWVAAFRDPDGHGIAITQWRPRQEAPATR